MWRWGHSELVQGACWACAGSEHGCGCARNGGKQCGDGQGQIYFSMAVAVLAVEAGSAYVMGMSALCSVAGWHVAHG